MAQTSGIEKASRKSASELKVVKKTSKFTQDEYKVVQEKMSALGIKNYSEFIRTLVFNYKPKYEITQDSKLIFELNKAGNNFNQLVKTFNTYAKTGKNSLWLSEVHEQTIKEVVSIIHKISNQKGR